MSEARGEKAERGGWGDVGHLIEILDVVPAGDRTYRSRSTRAASDRAVVEASQLLAQAVVAAGRHAPGRRAVSGHMVFFRVANATDPLTFALEEHSSGRSFTALSVRVAQEGRDRAASTLLLDTTAPSVMTHAAAPPPCPGPEDSDPVDMGVSGRDLRVAEGAYTGDPDAPLGPPVLDAWMRYRDVPADPYLHAALLLQFTGHMSIAAAMRPHAGIGQDQAHRTLSTGINAIGFSLHADVRADEWMRFHHHATFAGDGMTHSECRVYTEDERLIASFTVDAMVRGFGDPTQAADATRAL